VAIESFCEQTRGGGFADSASTGKQVSVVQPIMFDCVAQRASDGLLTRHFVKALWAPFASYYLIGH
jgi:hypothetical protein